MAAAFVKFRDLSFIWEVIIQLGFYLTPILYAMSLIPEKFQKIQLLNPMAQAMQDSRYALITHDDRVVTISRAFDGGPYQYIPFALVIFALIGGILYFKRQSKSFAEDL